MTQIHSLRGGHLQLSSLLVRAVPSATYRLADHPVSQVPDKMMGNGGSVASLS